MLCRFIELAPGAVDAPDSISWSPLFWACNNGHGAHAGWLAWHRECLAGALAGYFEPRIPNAAATHALSQQESQGCLKVCAASASLPTPLPAARRLCSRSGGAAAGRGRQPLEPRLQPAPAAALCCGSGCVRWTPGLCLRCLAGCARRVWFATLPASASQWHVPPGTSTAYLDLPL